jgi:hypothetical protein
LIVFAKSDTEDDRRYVFKAVNPLLSFTSLATNIKHATLG